MSVKVPFSSSATINKLVTFQKFCFCDSSISDAFSIPMPSSMLIGLSRFKNSISTCKRSQIDGWMDGWMGGWMDR